MLDLAQFFGPVRHFCASAVIGWFAFAAVAGSVAQAEDSFRSITPDAKLSGWVVEGVAYHDKGTDKPVWTSDGETVSCLGRGLGFLRFDEKLTDFVLQGEYQLEAKTNSGVGIRTVKYVTGERATRPSFAAYEIQILDDAGKPTDVHSTMSLYRYVAPKVNASRPTGEWNQFEITCRGPQIRIVLNGQVVQDIDQTTVDAIKDKPLSGYICLQNHNDNIKWRNLKLKVLKDEHAAASTSNPSESSSE